MERTSVCVLGAGLIAVAALTLGGCEEQGPAERAGERIDNAARDTDRNLERAGENAKDAAKDAGDAVEEAGEDLQDAARDANRP